MQYVKRAVGAFVHYCYRFGWGEGKLPRFSKGRGVARKTFCKYCGEQLDSSWGFHV